jgi:hypothetical protein
VRGTRYAFTPHSGMWRRKDDMGLGEIEDSDHSPHSAGLYSGILASMASH